MCALWRDAMAWYSLFPWILRWQRTRPTRAFVRNDRGPEPSVHLSLLSLMEELLLPPEHSLSSPPSRTEERSKSRGERKEGATETRQIRGEKRRRKGKLEEWCGKKEQNRKREEEKEKKAGIDVRSGYATSPWVQIGRCGPCRQLLSVWPTF